MAVLGRNVASALAPLSSHLPLVSVPPTRSRLLSPLAPTPISYPQSTNTIDLMRNRRDAEGLYFECSNGAGSLVGPCMKAHRQHDSQVTTSSPCVNFVRFEAHAMWFCSNLSLSCRARAVGCTSWVMEHGFYAPSTRFASVSLWSACRGVHVVGHGTWVLRSLDTLRFCFSLERVPLGRCFRHGSHCACTVVCGEPFLRTMVLYICMIFLDSRCMTCLPNIPSLSLPSRSSLHASLRSQDSLGL